MTHKRACNSPTMILCSIIFSSNACADIRYIIKYIIFMLVIKLNYPSHPVCTDFDRCDRKFLSPKLYSDF